MTIKTKYFKLIYIGLIIGLAFINISLIQSLNESRDTEERRNWERHREGMLFVDRLLDQLASDFQTRPVPVDHIKDKFYLFTAAQVRTITDSDYDDLHLIIGEIQEELTILINNEEQVSENEMIELGKEIGTLNNSLQEHYFNVPYENKDNAMTETRIILLDILAEITSISDTLKSVK